MRAGKARGKNKKPPEAAMKKSIFLILITIQAAACMAAPDANQLSGARRETRQTKQIKQTVS